MAANPCRSCLGLIYFATIVLIIVVSTITPPARATDEQLDQQETTTTTATRAASQDEINKQQPAEEKQAAAAAATDPTGYFTPSALYEQFAGNLTFDEYVGYSMRSLAQVAGFDNDLHRYDDKQHLVDSFARNRTRDGLLAEDLHFLANAKYDSSEFELMHDQTDLTLIENELNQAKCARQLDFLYEQALVLMKSYESFTQSRRLDLIDFLDSFGAAPSEQLLMGNNQWLGSFQQCRRARVDMSAPVKGATERGPGLGEDQSDNFRGRYCVAKLRLPSWPAPEAATLSQNSSESIKLGVCLPQACNSISILRHSNRLEALLKLVRLRQVPYSNAQLIQLYCLPDENSPLRQLSTSARVFLVAVSSWLALILYVSLKFQYKRTRREQLIDANCDTKQQQQHHHHHHHHHHHQGAGITPQTSDAAGAVKTIGQLRESKLEQIFAFQYAWQKLFATDNASSDGPHSKVASPTSLAEEPTAVADGAQNGRVDGGDDGHPPAMMGQNLRDFLAQGPLQPRDKAPSVYKSIVVIQAKARHQDDDQHHDDVRADDGVVIRPEKVSESGSPIMATSSMKVTPLLTQAARGDKKPQLNVIDGIKVISMIWLVSAHTMLFFIRTISNGRDFWTLLLDFRFLTIMAGIFPVDSFFTVTGVLTSYLKFTSGRGDKTSQRQTLCKLSYWLENFVHRYLRFMPMYLLIFWYTRDVSEYIGQGPMWDYATASTSLRSVCKRESVLVPMFFQANFKPIDQHCVKPAWYLANDYQYLLITPLFMLALLLSRWIGYIMLAASVAASLVMQFLTVYYPQESPSEPTFTDFGGLVNFKPMFAAYVLKDLWRLYVLPYNRIPPYLIGLLTGHLMYRHSKRRLREAAATNHELQPETGADQCPPSPALSRASTESFALSTSSGVSSSVGQSHVEQQPSGVSVTEHENGPTRTNYSTVTKPEQGRIIITRGAAPSELSLLLGFLRRGLINLNIWSPLILLMAVIYLPLASKLVEPQEGENARIGASLVIAMMRFVWSMSIARLIYVCFTTTSPTRSNAREAKRNSSFIIDMLTSSLWKPWSKIGLSVLLIQWEVIGYVAQIQTSQPFMSTNYMLAMVLICIVASYALGLIIYLTFEFPLSQIELLFIRPKLFGTTNKK